MLSYPEALQRVLTNASRLGSERVALRHAVGRVLAETLTATLPLPRFDYSAMDGYALRASNLATAGPWMLPIAGESRAGSAPAGAAEGTACRIFTGAAMPVGTDTVVAQEEVTLCDSGIELASLPTVHQHVRRRGEDLEVGGTALHEGTVLGPFHLGLAAALDRVSLSVARRPRVTIVCTGDELREPGHAGGPHSIPESNGLSVALQAERAGAWAELGPLAADSPKVMRATLEQALGSADLLVTIGGVSVGDYDVVRPALEAAGATLDFWRVKIKPGKPLVYGRAGATHILGLPGNPVSAQVTFALFGLPLLRALQGHSTPSPTFHTTRLLAPLQQRPGRLGLYRGRATPAGVLPLDNQASGNVVSLARADVLIAVPADSSGYESGEQVEVLRLDEL